MLGAVAAAVVAAVPAVANAAEGLGSHDQNYQNHYQFGRRQIENQEDCREAEDQMEHYTQPENQGDGWSEHPENHGYGYSEQQGLHCRKKLTMKASRTPEEKYYCFGDQQKVENTACQVSCHRSQTEEEEDEKYPEKSCYQ